ncbi:hypothetical protein DUNSADRAFT_18625 [Dunaliella salina]|uniref:MYND-type domain-containing protein n=1 Tax=Dunaliella salina TaxID=3046 RepID=A0ABQ7FZS3_DUNSA|nr:hypothetical protein DUNSADRAFT_18625 [Dunaliella salina]|eukprot:KAF5827849.1 hypothetical protein DUNSADRAFT_18625 [Dunaliella salina]
MEDLSDDLAKQFKYAEALTLTEKSLDVRARVYGVHSAAYQGNVPRRRDQLKAQSTFWSKAEKRFGARRNWTQPEDEIGAIMYQDTVREAQGARKRDPKLWDTIKEAIVERRKPAPYNPADQASVHWAAVMAALGVHDGYYCDQPVCFKLHHKIKPFVRSLGPSDPSDVATSDFVAVVSAMKKAMPGGLGMREETALEDAYAAVIAMVHNKPMALESAERVAQSFQATRQMEAEKKHNTEVLARTENVVPGLGPTSKPLKMCMGCGLKDVKMQRCSRCLQAYACCKECFITAWPHHKRSCVQKAKKEDSAQARSS